METALSYISATNGMITVLQWRQFAQVNNDINLLVHFEVSR